MADERYGRNPYETLRAEILSLDLVPGERLTERGLEARLDASRTPIRAALFRLEGEGLTQREGRGWRVAPIDLTEIRALAEYREAVESAVVGLVVQRASDDDLAAVATLAEDLSGDLEGGGSQDPEESGLRAGSDFHVVLAGLSGNPFFADAIQDVMTRLLRTRYLEVRTPESRAGARAEHREIACALVARDVERASGLIRAHSRGTMDRLLTQLHDEQRRLRGRGFSIVTTDPQPVRSVIR